MGTKTATDLNITTKFLVNLVFSKSALPMLIQSGLVNAYLDDYGYKCKYQNCLFFLFNTKNKYYDGLERKIASFASFLDWYDVDNSGLRMLVFKIGHAYQLDLHNLKHMKNFWYSEEFKRATKLEDNVQVNLDYSKEIYRYKL